METALYQRNCLVLFLRLMESHMMVVRKEETCPGQHLIYVTPFILLQICLFQPRVILIIPQNVKVKKHKILMEKRAT